MLKRGFTIAVLAGCLAAWSGCSRSAGTLDKVEERDPLLRRAMSLKSVQDYDGAIDTYNKALDRKPTLARAHLELGLLYDTQKQDYVRAIYHYQRYLELRSDTEKRALIEGLIRQAKLAYAASLPHQPGGAIEEIAMLKRENQVLKAQLDQKGPPPPAATANAAAPAGKAALQPPKPEPAQPAMQTYTVQSGDTLSKIAGKMYKDPDKWKVVYDANRATLGRPENVKAGQMLIIPRLDAASPARP